MKANVDNQMSRKYCIEEDGTENTMEKWSKRVLIWLVSRKMAKIITKGRNVWLIKGGDVNGAKNDARK